MENTYVYLYGENNRLVYEMNLYNNGQTNDSSQYNGWRKYIYYEQITVPRDIQDMTTVPVLYPVPASQLLTVTMSHPYVDMGYQVYDASGRLVAQGDLSANAYMINVSAMPVGSYTLRLHPAGQRDIVSRFTVAH